MKFKIYKASNWDYERDAEINSLEDLKDLKERFMLESDCYPDPPYRIIIDFEERTIKIYDYYIE